MKPTRNESLISNIEKIEYCRADMVDTETPMNNYNLQKTIPYLNTWETFYFTKKTAKLIQKVSRKNGVITYHQKLTVNIPGYDGRDSKAINKMFPFSTLEAIRHPLVLRITLCDGHVIIIGRSEDPVTLQENFEISTKKTGNKITFLRESREHFNYEGVPHYHNVFYFDKKKKSFKTDLGDRIYRPF